MLLVDGSIFVLHGLKTFLSESDRIVIVDSARTEAEAFAALRTCQPDVVILAVRVGRANGIEMCRVIRESHPNIGVLFFTAYNDRHLLYSAILAGAHGYLLKSASREDVVKSIEIVAAGNAILDHQSTQHVITWVRSGGWITPSKPVQEFSADDQRILSLITAGKTNKEIAQVLQVAPRAVATSLQKLYKRLRISKRTEAASYFAQFEKGPLRNTNLPH